MIHYNTLSLLVQEFNLILDPVVNTLVKYSENIVFFPDINMNVFEIFFSLEQFPEVELLKLLFLHDFLELGEQMKELSDEKIADNI